MEIATVEPPKLMNRSNRPFLPVKHPRPKKHPSREVEKKDRPKSLKSMVNSADLGLETLVKVIVTR